MYQFPSAKPEALVSQLNDFLVVLCGADGKIASWHQPIEEQLGYSAEDIIGKPISQLISDGCEGIELRHIPGIHWVMAKNGGKVPMTGLTLRLANGQGGLTGFAHVLRSVASYQSAEINSRVLAGALEHSNVLIRRWDGVIEHWTGGCEQLYGFTAEEATGKVLHELLKTEYPLPLEQLQEQLAVAGVWRGELKQCRKNGTRVFVSAQLVKIEPSPGEMPLIVSTYSDITSRLEMQHELESANARLKAMADELERSNEELEEFARIASHDLSAPIISTRWLVELLATRHGRQLDADGQKALAQVGISLERMADLVDAVLAHAKVGTSAISTSEEADTGLAIEIALENLRRDVTTTGAKIQYADLPALLIGQQPLTQLFQNLLSNAIKYRRPDTAPQVQVRAERHGSMWRVAVQDNGIGIEAEWFDRIFMPMQRLHSSKIAGSGIGLATCRKIVNRAGGRIWVESDSKTGSTFFFTLPGPLGEPKDFE